VPEDYASNVIKSFKGMYLEDRKLQVHFAQEEDQPAREKKKFYDKEFSSKGKKKKSRY
jgi:ATP-dependent RNA helicase DeaD